MSSIEELELFGIRSFNPNLEEKQRIVFQKPLTVILGTNGAGKTTIIESLLYACTGETPPGGDGKGQSFVYDPSAAGLTQVKGQVRLTVSGPAGKACIIRTLECSVGKSKKSVKNLDCTLWEKDEATGRLVSASYMQAPATTKMTQLLGVSTSVLKHVIFCHQEDCNWPLGPDKMLKERFDELFNATRYEVALTKLHDEKKKKAGELKELESELTVLRLKKEDAHKLKADMEASKEDARVKKAEQKSLEPQLLQLAKAKRALDAVRDNAASLQQQIHSLRGGIDAKTVSIQRMGLSPCPQTLQELLAVQKEFDATLKTMAATSARDEGVKAAAEASQAAKREEVRRCQHELAVLQADEDRHRKAVAELGAVARSISSEFVLGEAAVDEKALRRVMEQVAANRDTAAEQLAHRKRASDAANAELSAKRDQKQRLMDIEGKERELKEGSRLEAKQRSAAQRKALDGLGPALSGEMLQRARMHIEELRRRLVAAEALRKEGLQYKEAAALEEEVARTNRLVAALRVEMAKAKADGREQNKVLEGPVLEKQIADKQQAIEAEIREQILPALEALGGAKPKTSALRDVSLAVEQVHDRRRVDAAQAAEQLQTAGLDVSALTGKLADSQRNVSFLETELQRARSKCASVLGNAPDAMERFDDALAAAEEQYLKACRHQSSVESMASCYEAFVETAKNQRLCAVCKRGLPDEALVDFVKLNDERRKSSPAEIARSAQDAAKAKEQAERLRKIGPDVLDVRRLAAELADAKKLVATLSREVDAKRELLAARAARNTELDAKLQAMTDVASRMQRANIHADELARLSQQLAEVKRVAASRVAQTHQRPLDELEQEYERLTAAQQLVSGKLNELHRQQGSESHATEATLKTEIFEAELELQKNQMTLEKQTVAAAGLAEAEAEAAACVRRIDEIAVRRQEHQQSIDTLRKEMDNTAAASQAAIRDLEQKLAVADTHKRTFDSSAEAVLKYIKARLSDRVTSLREALRLAQAAVKKDEDEILKLQQKIAELKKTLDEQEKLRYDVRRYIELLERQQELAADQARLKDAEQALQSLQSDRIKEIEGLLGPKYDSGADLFRTREAIQLLETQLQRKSDVLTGELRNILQALDKAQKDYESKYARVEKEYNVSFLKLQTTRLTEQDIGKFIRALDKAVQSYHQSKIEEINKIVNELWKETYRHTDIDTIELQSNSVSELDTASNATRRKYNYALVMKRGSTTMEMRGFCSAGQKVLASVIIRLALSEAFSCDCGILALDEPTTNLDEENAKGLAEAIRNLIDRRQAMKNFQLVLITHDEQFVRALGPDHFYYVKKDLQGAFSVIEQRMFKDM